MTGFCAEKHLGVFGFVPRSTLGCWLLCREAVPSKHKSGCLIFIPRQKTGLEHCLPFMHKGATVKHNPLSQSFTYSKYCTSKITTIDSTDSYPDLCLEAPVLSRNRLPQRSLVLRRHAPHKWRVLCQHGAKKLLSMLPHVCGEHPQPPKHEACPAQVSRRSANTF